MFPLHLVKAGECVTIEKISGTPEVKTHLQDLGFVKGAELKVISVLNGNIIVNIKGTRVGLHEEMASKIYTTPIGCERMVASCPS